MHDDIQELAERLRGSGRLQALAVSPSGFAFDPRTGQSFTLNPSGMEVLGRLGEGVPLVDAARDLAARYGVPVEVALSSAETFVRQLERYLS